MAYDVDIWETPVTVPWSHIEGKGPSQAISHHGNERRALKLLNILYCLICDAALLQVSTCFTEDYFTKHYESLRNILEYLAHHLVRNIMCAHDFWLEMPLRISEYVDNGNIVGSLNYAFYAGHTWGYLRMRKCDCALYTYPFL